MPTIEQWQRTWSGLGAPAPAEVFDRLIASYSEPHRKYHTTRHLDECFAELRAVRSEARRPEEIELAIWFHDAVYDTKRKTNERESADWARSVMRAAGLSETSAARVTAMILATRHDV